MGIWSVVVFQHSSELVGTRGRAGISLHGVLGRLALWASRRRFNRICLCHLRNRYAFWHEPDSAMATAKLLCPLGAQPIGALTTRSLSHWYADQGSRPAG
jgi:hypothetical protein